ncbi:cobyrinic acid a,c-diamide synthase [Paenibacillus sambharensis]|uniref:Cobyrinate a,c-diamide synthase n=1 Tax=Paenibacillus sambharensis TaxID=1803190 RepID=A0A2W1LAF7_9BACL|nr:cobyrinate a,c-diamide synthase [Paenibacillus sambharensis]PZD96206.1 cobyrinic acid a,c-diamide synthase [Paenibacillus sambharensis]
MTRRLVIAGTGSGTGKTTLTIGLMAALRKRGHVVQGFKCGPDYIDPTYHTAVTGRVSRNLDSWMTSPAIVKEVFSIGSAGADISIVEGVMGMYDGKDPASDEGSSAHIAEITASPVVLVVNCQSMARSAAAIVKGFQAFSPKVRIAGVICNRVGSANHFRIVRTAIEQTCGVPVLGYLERHEGIEIPERHLGLVPSIERGELDGLFEQLAELVEQTLDIEQLLQLAECEPLEAALELFAARSADGSGRPDDAAHKRVKIAVARDAAFHFYYPENLELLEAGGAELVYFSPLAGEQVPDEAAGLYIGGGFPEEFAAVLTEQTAVMQSIRQAVEDGMPTIAECGGFMYLTEAIETTDGGRYPMVGLIPGYVRMQRKLAALGYREMRGMGEHPFLLPEETARGHEFHYSTYHPGDEGALKPAYQVKGMRGEKLDGHMSANLVAGYTHMHFASAPQLPARMVEACRNYKNQKQGADAKL